MKRGQLIWLFFRPEETACMAGESVTKLCTREVGLAHRFDCRDEIRP